MSIYRGTGSASTTTDQATIDEVTTQATNAASSATSAASSASSAASSASSASSSASTATTQASAASTSASSASSSASTATTKANEASGSATNAAASATTASSHATNASTAKDAAVVAQGLAEDAQLAAETAKGLAEGFKDLAATSASSASASASTATTKAGEALASANSASNAQTAAEAAQAAAEAAQAAIDGTYLGAQASNPTGDGNGNDVTVGDWYFNTTANQAYIYNGSTWDALAPDLIGDATPQLGGNLDLNSNDITGTGNINVTGTVTASGEISANGGIALGDNDKATFGASDDLQIYHDGLHSVIKDAGTGYLKIGLSDQGTAIQNTAGNNLLVTDATDVSLRHNGSEVFTTTSTGIDVTGTVTADGLTVEGASLTVDNGYGITSVGAVKYIADSDNNAPAAGLIHQFFTDNGTTLAATIAKSGDINFYDSAGSSQSFYWDASAESLGINTTAPKAELHIVGPDGDAEGVPSFNADSVAIFQNNGAAGDASIVNIISGTTGNGWIVFGDKDDSIRQAIVASQSDDSLSFRTGNNSEAVHIDNVGNVGIGTSSPQSKLHVAATGNMGARIDSTNGGIVSLGFWAGGSSKAGITANRAATNLCFDVDSSEAMRLDASGNLLVGKTSTDNFTIAGTQIDADGFIAITRDGSVAGIFNRETSDGDILQFRKDNTTVGSIGTIGGYTYFTGESRGLAVRNSGIYPCDTSGIGVNGTLDIGTSGARFKDLYLAGGVYAEDYILAASGSTFSIYPKSGATSHNTFLYCQKSDGVNVGGGFDNGYAGAFRPSTDNTQDLGGSSHRWDDVYATNATIQTSDRNEKQDIEELSDAEQRVAVAAKGLLRKYRWINSVEEKGDDARIHFGIIAQDLEDAFTAEGLDAGRYAMFIHNEWWESEVTIPAVEEQTDEDGNVIVQAEPERTEIERYNSESDAPEGAVYKERRGIRYNQLLAFIIAAI